MEVRLDRLELMKEGSQFKTYSLRGNRKSKRVSFCECIFFICTLIALFEEIGDSGLRCLQMILYCNMEESQ